mgnify:CR=1 FL=1
MIIDSILNWLVGLLAGAPSFIYTTFMYIVLGLLSLLVPSSSGLAALTMPVMVPGLPSPLCSSRTRPSTPSAPLRA